MPLKALKYKEIIKVFKKQYNEINMRINKETAILCKGYLVFQ